MIWALRILGESLLRSHSRDKELSPCPFQCKQPRNTAIGTLLYGLCISPSAPAAPFIWYFTVLAGLQGPSRKKRQLIAFCKQLTFFFLLKFPPLCSSIFKDGVKIYTFCHCLWKGDKVKCFVNYHIHPLYVLMLSISYHSTSAMIQYFCNCDSILLLPVARS